jgi:peptide/nickel transport system permease protein
VTAAVTDPDTPGARPARDAGTGTARRPRPGTLWARAVHSPSTVAGGLIVAFFAVVALVSLAWTPYDPLAINPAAALHGSGAAHLLGTDQYGRDIASRLMAGTQVAFYVGVVAVVIAAGIGVPAGLLAAQHGGVADEVIMRIGDIIYGFPALLAAITLTAALGASSTVAMLAIGASYVPVFARVTRATALTVLSSGYVLAARSYGRRPVAIIRRHVLPNIAPVLIVQASMLYAVAILAESSLEFLGLGSPPPAPTWGAMIHDAQDYLSVDPMFTVWPSLVITLAVLGFSLLGDGLREILDPRLR